MASAARQSFIDVSTDPAPHREPRRAADTPDGTGTGAQRAANPRALRGQGAGPGGLPNAGFGESGSNSVATFIVLMGMVGVPMIGAGATVVTTNRRK